MLLVYYYHYTNERLVCSVVSKNSGLHNANIVVDTQVLSEINEILNLRLSSFNVILDPMLIF